MPLVASETVTSSLQAETSLTPWWGARSGLLIVGCFYLIQTVSLLVVNFLVAFGIAYANGITGALERFSEEMQVWLLPLSLLVGTMTAVVVSMQVAISCARPAVDIQWYRKWVVKPKRVKFLWGYVLLGMVLGSGFFLIGQFVVPPPEDLPQPLFEAMMAAPLSLQIGWVLMLVVLFPVIEECLFRGFLYTGLAQSWGSAVSFFLTTLVFVAVHIPKVLQYWPAAAAVTLIGSLTLWIRIRSQSLVPGIVLHGTYNGTLVVAALFFSTMPSDNWFS